MYRTALHFLTRPIAFVSVLAVLALGGAAWADSEDQNLAREAMLVGDISPLSDLMAVIAKSYEGDVLKAELEGEDVRRWGGTGEGEIWIYEIKLLTPQGNLVKLKYDAKTLKELSREGLDELRDIKHVEDKETKPID